MRLDPDLWRAAGAAAVALLAVWGFWRLAQRAVARRLLDHLTLRLRARELLPESATAPAVSLLRIWRPLKSFVEGVVLRYAGVHDEREKLRALVETFTSAASLPSLLHRREADAPGTRREMTVVFADIRGFTRMAEHLEPETVVKLLNGHLARMTAIIRKRDGEVNKFLGDGILALFRPSRVEGTWNDAQRAALAAHEMVYAFRDIADAWHYYLPEGVTVGLGVGIHTGEVVEGNLGSSEKLEFAVIGDTVNTASRLCALAPPGAVWASYDVVARLSGYFITNELEPVALKGKALPVALYRIVGVNVRPTA